MPNVPKVTSVFLGTIRASAPVEKAAITKLEAYLSGTYPCVDSDALKWWKVCRTDLFDFPMLSHIARDVLAIPGVSISVERLFSSSKHTLLDSRSSLAAKSASKTVVVKEWLKKGFGEDIHYLENVHTLS
jgi:hypothetical protein